MTIIQLWGQPTSTILLKSLIRSRISPRGSLWPRNLDLSTIPVCQKSGLCAVSTLFRLPKRSHLVILRKIRSRRGGSRGIWFPMFERFLVCPSETRGCTSSRIVFFQPCGGVAGEILGSGVFKRCCCACPGSLAKECSYPRIPKKGSHLLKITYCRRRGIRGQSWRYCHIL
jgi:hypothetical protein